MDEIYALINRGDDATLEQRKHIANDIITRYDLHFNANDIIKAFDNLRNIRDQWLVATLMHLSLTKNLRMFIALMYALLDRKMMFMWYKYLIIWPIGVELGCRCTNEFNVKNALQVWSNLHDYYEFDITGLSLSDPIKTGLQNHIDSKQTYTKPAVKVASLTKRAIK